MSKKRNQADYKLLSCPLPLHFSLKMCEESSDSYFTIYILAWLVGNVLAGLFFSQISESWSLRSLKWVPPP